MSNLNHFSIPFEGLKDGFHTFNFTLNNAFFKEFEASPIQEGSFVVDCTFEKKPKISILNFDFKGSYRTNCDRCLEQVDIPMSGEQTLLVKVHERMAGVEDEDVIFIDGHTSVIDLRQYLYEMVCVNMPMQNTFQCEDADPKPCNVDVLKLLGLHSDNDKLDSAFDSFLGIDFDNN
ncbi:MAG: DUF177 domain-containing protein [Lewinellaceae bacterium]|nr:DUF177 domain-containing protein [Lewinellaceae bacterium]